MTLLARILLQSLLVGLLTVLFLHVRPFSAPEPFRFVVKMTSDTAGRARLFSDYGHGKGFEMHNALGAEVGVGTKEYAFPLSEGTLAALRFWPMDRVGKVTIQSAAIVGPDGTPVYTFPFAATEIATAPGQGPDFKPPPLSLRHKLSIDPTRSTADALIAASTTAMLLFLWSLLPLRVCEGTAGGLVRVREGFERAPRFTLLLVACFATTLSCHPIIFGGKSFVSPYNGAQLLYDDTPTLPGGATLISESPRGADVGALMWAHVPYSVIQHRAVFEHGELPLWNRYVYCGAPLMGQGISMIGDPLHWLPISEAGASWAWDVKFLIAKTLFSLGVAFCVHAITGRLWLAALLALSSSFLGFFSYRFNHPAFFALCYSPWIIFAWLRAAACEKRVWPWALVLALANVWQLNSGVMKESTMLIASLNFTGALLILFSPRSFGECVRRLFVMIWGCALGAALSAPVWMLFLDSLGNSWTPYASAKATQIQPSLVIGLFDDLFYRQFTAWENHFNPSANFLILMGCVWALINVRTLLGNGAFLALVIGAVPSALLAFGVIPPPLIEDIPFLKSIAHVDNTFSVVLIVHLLLIAAFGLRELWNNARESRMDGDILAAMAIIAVLLAVFLGTAHAAHRDARSLLHVGEQVPMGDFFLLYAGALVVAVLALPWVVRSLRQRPAFGAVLLGGIALFVIHFRHGMWDRTWLDYYVMNPGPRANLAANSRTLDAIRSAVAENPARVAGYKNALVPGYNGVLGLEHFAGAEPLVSSEAHDLCEATGAEPMWGWRWILGDKGKWTTSRVLTDLWGVRYLVAMPSDIPADVPLERKDLVTKENPNAWPRAFFTSRVVRVNALSSFLAMLESDSTKPFAAIINSDGNSAASENLAGIKSDPAANYKLTPNTTSFLIKAPTSGVAVLCETFEEGDWRVTLNGQPATPFRVNHAFMAVNIPKEGDYYLKFEYWPRIMSAALWTALGGLVFFISTPALAFLLSRQKKEA